MLFNAIRPCLRSSDSAGRLVATSADHVFEVSAKVVIHERVDDRVCHVVGEVHVENDQVVRKQVECHEERRQVGDDKYDRHYEQHTRCLDVGHAVALAIARRLQHGVVRRGRHCPPISSRQRVQLHRTRVFHHGDDGSGCPTCGSSLSLRRRDDERHGSQFLALVSTASKEHRPVDEDVQRYDGNETDQKQAAVDLLEVPDEVVTEHLVRQIADAVVDLDHN